MNIDVREGRHVLAALVLLLSAAAVHRANQELAAVGQAIEERNARYLH